MGGISRQVAVARRGAQADASGADALVERSQNLAQARSSPHPGAQVEVELTLPALFSWGQLERVLLPRAEADDLGDCHVITGQRPTRSVRRSDHGEGALRLTLRNQP